MVPGRYRQTSREISATKPVVEKPPGGGGRDGSAASMRQSSAKKNMVRLANEVATVWKDHEEYIQLYTYIILYIYIQYPLVICYIAIEHGP